MIFDKCEETCVRPEFL